MKRAYVGIREQPVYRQDAFIQGLKAVGYDVQIGPPQTFDAETVYCCWNRYGSNHDYCTRLEQAGGIAVICENGYLAPGGISPHDQNPRSVYALGLGYHNDSTAIREGGPERWNALGVDLKPWRADGGHILICPNRAFGTPGRMMPPDWPLTVRTKLRGLTKREIRVRPHPGNSAPVKPLAEDLAGAWACVIWASSAGVHALVGGIPMIALAPFWIAKGAAGADLAEIENPPMPDRLPAMRRLAWGQWHLSEIESGEAFRHLLGTP